MNNKIEYMGRIFVRETHNGQTHYHVIFNGKKSTTVYYDEELEKHYQRHKKLKRILDVLL